MENLVLRKTKKGKKYLYEVIDTTTGEAVAGRISARDYVACTADADMFFGRLDLIGKGEHGSQLRYYTAKAADMKESEEYRAGCRRRVKELNDIVYLQKD